MRQLAAALVQARVLDRDRRVRRQQLDHLLVVERERRAVLLLGQVQRADHLAAGDDRHAQERAHHRVRARPPAAEARVGRDVLGQVRLGRVQHRAEHPVRARQRPHRLDQLVAHPGRDEALERALAVGDPERGVARAAELARGVHEPLQDGRTSCSEAIASTTSESARKAVLSAAAIARYVTRPSVRSTIGQLVLGRGRSDRGLTVGDPAVVDREPRAGRAACGSRSRVRASSSSFWNTPPESTTTRLVAQRLGGGVGDGVVEAGGDERDRDAARRSSTTAAIVARRRGRAAPASPRVPDDRAGMRAVSLAVGERLELDRGLALVGDRVADAAERGDRVEQAAHARRHRRGEAGAGERGDLFPLPAATRRRRSRPATRTPSARARGSRPRRPASAPATGGRAARSRRGRRAAARRPRRCRRCRSRCRRRSRPPRAPRRARRGTPRGGRGGAGRRPPAARGRARTWSRGTPGAGRARPARARPRTGAGSARSRRVKERSVS